MELSEQVPNLVPRSPLGSLHIQDGGALLFTSRWMQYSELNVDNWNDNCEAKSEAKSPMPLRGNYVTCYMLHVTYVYRT